MPAKQQKDLTVLYNAGANKVSITGGDDGHGKLTVDEATDIVFDKSHGGGDFSFSEVVISTAPIPCPPPSIPPLPRGFDVRFPTTGPNAGKLVIVDDDTDETETVYNYAIGVTPAGTTTVVWSDPQIVNRPQ